MLGAVLAGGSSSRFGSPKALARVGGQRLVDRTLSAVAAAGRGVLISNDPRVTAAVPSRADERPGLGPIGGIATALSWARGEGLDGALCVACDMPFVSTPLLRLIVDAARELPDHVVVPESGGRRGFEPLCAYYPVTALELLDRVRSPHRLVECFPTNRIPLSRIREAGDPGTLFFNVNTREDLERAERIAAELR